MSKKNKKNSSKKQNKSKQPNHSYVDSKGRAFFKHTGRYNEVKKDAIGTMPGTPGVGD